MPIHHRAFRRLAGRIAFAILLCSSLDASAQTTQQAIEARLKGHPLYLRGQWASDKLQFDLAGATSSSAISAPFTLCGFDVKKINLTSDRLEIDGNRIGLEFQKYIPKRVSLGTAVHVYIAGSPGADYGPALDKIFTDGLADLVPSLPFYWQKYAQAHLIPGNSVPTPPKPPRPAHMVQPTEMPEAVFSETARRLGYAALSTVHIIVSEDGTIHDPYIVSPAGLGLDEQALLAVAHYKFKPATKEDGTPVAMELDVEINFHFVVD